MTHPIIKRDQVSLRAAPKTQNHAETRVLSGSHDHPAPGEKGVRLLEEDGEVRAIELVCSCGEVTLIQLEYPGQAA